MCPHVKRPRSGDGLEPVKSQQRNRKKNQVGILELKNKITETKTRLGAPNSRMEKTEERTCRLEEKT